MSTQDEPPVPSTADIKGLRTYYLTGPGSAIIVWGTPGDLRRCHREVMKNTDDPAFTSDDVWGFCNNLHKLKTGRPNDPDD